MRLDGRTALVTGAAGGIGTALCAAFAAAGARVVGLDLPGKPIPGTAPGVAADLADLPTASARVCELDAELGGIDVLVNNAAINPLKSVDGYDLEEFERVQRINGHAALALTQALVGGMKARRRGVILNICSITLSGGWSDFTAYVASKGTLLGLTRSLARELGVWEIRVNAISPGAIPTALEREVWADQLESYERFILERQALKYRGSPEDVANMALYLASELGRFITGQNVIVDGGWWMG
jgi:NAD(P)-dependent dehydrogenase (short-subunit alcohol dehydrogenase family)